MTIARTVSCGALAVVRTTSWVIFVASLARAVGQHGTGREAFQTRWSHGTASPGPLRPTNTKTKTRRSSSTPFRRFASVSPYFGEESPFGCCFAVRPSPWRRASTPRQSSRGLGHERLPLLQARRMDGNAGASGESARERQSSPTDTRRKAARVVVRRAKERDYRGVAEIREVIIPVGMSGATGFMGNKVVIDSPEEAERRVLMAKVADLVSGEATALIALEGQRIVGTVDCILRPECSTAAGAPLQPGKQPDKLGGGSTPITKQATQVLLKNLFVLPEERRRGIARELVRGAELFARKEKAATVCLDVARQNAPARELYASCGFEETERPGPVEGGMGGALLKSLGMGKRYMIKSV